MAELEFEQSQAEAGPTIQLNGEQEAKYERITRSLQEVTSADVLRKVLSEDKTPVAYWGSATTGRPHIAYYVPLTKIADFLTAGVRLHAFLDASKSTLETLKWRVKYYSFLFKAIFITLGVPVDKLEFVTGTSYQLSAEYTLDVYKFHSLTTAKAAEHAGADVVKASESPLMSSMLYPGLQALDEEYLGVDFQFGGVDQRKIFMYAAHYLPRLGYAKRAHLMNTMVPGLSGGKMSSSDPKSKIDFLDSPAEIKSKLKAAVCTPKVVEGNGVLAFLKTVLIPVQQLRVDQGKGRDAGSFVKPDAPEGTIFSISRPEKFGGDMHFNSYAEIEAAYEKEELHPGDLKTGVTEALVALLKPVQEMFEQNEEWKEAERLGYPSADIAAIVASAQQGAGNKTEGKVKPAKGERTKPPSDEERAALRAAKEQEKLAKAQAKNTLGPDELKGRQAAAVAVEPKVNADASGSGSGSQDTVTSTEMPKLKLLARGKVRDIYELPDEGEGEKLLFVATDRISAFDIIMENGIPQKGKTLTTLSLFWFHKLRHIIPNHVLTPSIDSDTPLSLDQSSTTSWEEFPRSLDEYRDQLEGRSMIVKKCEVVKIEAIVRGYITGSAWSEYKRSKTVHGIEMPEDLVESQKLQRPLFTPSTKADQGEHDENIHPDKVKDICGADLAAEIERVAIRIYAEAADYALARGLILADTKFEFGLLPTPTSSDPGKKTLILIDELLTPDSSRYWSAADYKQGQPQASFDKQYLRDWLIKEGLKNKEGVKLPEDVVKGTKDKYEEARDRVMGRGVFGGVHGKKGVKVEESELQTDQVADAIEVESRKAEGVHGKKGLKLEENGLQTDQVADATETEARKAEGVHGKKGLKLEENGLQTDQVADATETEARKAEGIHGKKGLKAEETGLQTDQVADAIEDEARKL